MGDHDELERARRVVIYAELLERDRRRSLFAWPDSPPARAWSDPGRVTLWRPVSG